MNKDTQLLDKVSNKFTEETLKTILLSATGEKTATVTGWELAPAAAKGDNYLSIVYRASIEGVTGGKDTKISVIIKGLPNNAASIKTFRSTEFFYNEIYFYNNVRLYIHLLVNNKN